MTVFGGYRGQSVTQGSIGHGAPSYTFHGPGLK